MDTCVRYRDGRTRGQGMDAHSGPRAPARRRRPHALRFSAFMHCAVLAAASAFVAWSHDCRRRSDRLGEFWPPAVRAQSVDWAEVALENGEYTVLSHAVSCRSCGSLPAPPPADRVVPCLLLTLLQ